MGQLLWINGWTGNGGLSCGLTEAAKFILRERKHTCYVHCIQELVG